LEWKVLQEKYIHISGLNDENAAVIRPLKRDKTLKNGNCKMIRGIHCKIFYSGN
jgi:hypothetical protein